MNTRYKMALEDRSVLMTLIKNYFMRNNNHSCSWQLSLHLNFNTRKFALFKLLN